MLGCGACGQCLEIFYSVIRSPGGGKLDFGGLTGVSAAEAGSRPDAVSDVQNNEKI